MEEPVRLEDALREWSEAFMDLSFHGAMQFAKEQNLTLPQIGALLHISQKAARGISHIGEDLGVTSAAVSQMLERLVQQGLIDRSEDPNDRRAKRIVLTERGVRIVKESTEARQRWFGALCEAMSVRERKVAVAALRMLTGKIHTLEKAGGAIPKAQSDGSMHAHKESKR